MKKISKKFEWDEKKNVILIDERHISFEEIVDAIIRGGLIDVLEHPNKKKYRYQKLFVVRHKNYVYIVPFVETRDKIFLKTIIPSRKATKKYGVTKNETKT